MAEHDVLHVIIDVHDADLAQLLLGKLIGQLGNSACSRYISRLMTQANIFNDSTIANGPLTMLTYAMALADAPLSRYVHVEAPAVADADAHVHAGDAPGDRTARLCALARRVLPSPSDATDAACRPAAAVITMFDHELQRMQAKQPDGLNASYEALKRSAAAGVESLRRTQAVRPPSSPMVSLSLRPLVAEQPVYADGQDNHGDTLVLCCSFGTPAGVDANDTPWSVAVSDLVQSHLAPLIRRCCATAEVSRRHRAACHKDWLVAPLPSRPFIALRTVASAATAHESGERGPLRSDARLRDWLRHSPAPLFGTGERSEVSHVNGVWSLLRTEVLGLFVYAPWLFETTTVEMLPPLELCVAQRGLSEATCQSLPTARQYAATIEASWALREAVDQQTEQTHWQLAQVAAPSPHHSQRFKTIDLLPVFLHTITTTPASPDAGSSSPLRDAEGRDVVCFLRSYVRKMREERARERRCCAPHEAPHETPDARRPNSVQACDTHALQSLLHVLTQCSGTPLAAYKPHFELRAHHATKRFRLHWRRHADVLGALTRMSLHVMVTTQDLKLRRLTETEAMAALVALRHSGVLKPRVSKQPQPPPRGVSSARLDPALCENGVFLYEGPPDAPDTPDTADTSSAATAAAEQAASKFLVLDPRPDINRWKNANQHEVCAPRPSTSESQPPPTMVYLRSLDCSSRFLLVWFASLMEQLGPEGARRVAKRFGPPAGIIASGSSPSEKLYIPEFATRMRPMDAALLLEAMLQSAAARHGESLSEALGAEGTNNASRPRLRHPRSSSSSMKSRMGAEVDTKLTCRECEGPIVIRDSTRLWNGLFATHTDVLYGLRLCPCSDDPEKVELVHMQCGKVTLERVTKKFGC